MKSLKELHKSLIYQPLSFIDEVSDFLKPTDVDYLMKYGKWLEELAGDLKPISKAQKDFQHSISIGQPDNKAATIFLKAVSVKEQLRKKLKMIIL